jgi:hypothetical protein
MDGFWLMGMNSNSKCGEYKLSLFLTDHEYPMGQQFSQSADSPGVVFHRKDNRLWLDILPPIKLLRIIKRTNP